MDISDNLIINTQRMSNTTIQGSKINGGSVAQSFNIQAMRIVKGIVNINSSKSLNPGDGAGPYNGIMSDENGNPITLSNGDVLLALVIENISGQEFISLPGSYGGWEICFCDSNGLNLYPNINSFGFTAFNSGYNLTIKNSSAFNPYVYINLHALQLSILINPIQTVGITLLVSNANVCQ
jgi:hypothetical protein